jgi:serine phosphatase RsbU (regulator of sigma subunit)
MAVEPSPSLPSASPRPPAAGTRGAPLLRTLPGRAIVAGVAIKLLVAAVRLAGGSVPAIVGLLDSAAGLAIAGGAAYFLVRLFLRAKRRLLWRVRRKLTLSYIFIGFVPALLIITFFLLSGLLLFFNMSSYMLRTRLNALVDETRFLAQSAALELERAGGIGEMQQALSRREAAVTRYPFVSYAVVPAQRVCNGPALAPGVPPTNPITAGAWAHVDAPSRVPAWIPCEGQAGLVIVRTEGIRSDVAARAVVWPDGASYAVIVDVPLGDRLVRELQGDTGITLRNITALEALEGEAPASDPQPTGVDAATSPPVRIFVGPVNMTMAGDPGERFTWVTFMEYADWDTGDTRTLTASFSLAPAAVWERISGTSLSRLGNFNFGQILLIMLAVVGGLFLVIQAIALVMGLTLARSITGSVHELFAGTERVQHGDFTYKIPIPSRDQLGELAQSFNSMTASIEGLMLEAAEKKRLEEELRIAHEIQMSLLPQGPLVMPGLSATALCIPAREVGGDYYDFLPLDDHRVGILIADVSGKGTSAAFYMAQLKGLVLSLSAIHSSPCALLVAANAIIARHLDARTFITVTYAIVDLRARTMTYARAGHTPLIHVPGATNVVSPSRRARILAPSGMVVGLKLDHGEMFERLLEEETIQLGAGDLFVFFTDGISEAMNSADDCFGEVRLGQLVEDHADLPPDELRERVLREVLSFVDGAPQHDDMTMILVRVEEPWPPITATQISTTEDGEERTTQPVLASVSSVVES